LAGRAAPGRGGQPVLVLTLADHPDPEHHVRVLQAAELGALAVVQADLLEGEVELVVGARDGLNECTTSADTSLTRIVWPTGTTISGMVSGLPRTSAPVPS
jgi:hypothetical protein